MEHHSAVAFHDNINSFQSEIHELLLINNSTNKYTAVEPNESNDYMRWWNYERTQGQECESSVPSANYSPDTHCRNQNTLIGGIEISYGMKSKPQVITRKMVTHIFHCTCNMKGNWKWRQNKTDVKRLNIMNCWLQPWRLTDRPANNRSLSDWWCSNLHKQGQSEADETSWLCDQTKSCVGSND